MSVFLQRCRLADYITESGADHRVYQLVNDTIQGVLNRIALAEEDVKKLDTLLAEVDELAEIARNQLEESLKHDLEEQNKNLSSKIDQQGNTLSDKIDQQVDSLSGIINQQGQDFSDRLRQQEEALKAFASTRAEQAQLAAIEAAQQLVQDAQTELQTAIDSARVRMDRLNTSTNERIDSLHHAANERLDSHEQRMADISRAMLDSILALQKADAILNQGIIAAQARADQAYQLAEQDSMRIDSLAIALYHIQDSLGQTNLTLEETRKRLTETEGSLASLTDDFRSTTVQLQHDIATLQTQMVQVQTDIANQQATLDAHTGQLTSLQQTDNMILDRLDAMAATDQQLADDIATNYKAIVEHQQDIISLQSDLQEVRDSLNEVAIRAQAYTDQQCEAVRLMLETVAAEHAAQLLAHSEQLDEHGELLAVYEERLNAYRDSLEQNRQMLEEVFGDVDALKALLDERYNAVMAVISTLASQEELQTAIGALEGEIRENDERVNARVDSLGAIVEAQSRMLDIIDLAYRSAEERIADLEDAVTSLQERMVPLEDRVDSMMSVLSDLNGRVDELFGCVGDLSDRIQKLITGIVYQDKNVKNVYARVTNTGNVVFKPGSADTIVVFPRADFDGAQELTVDRLNIQREAGYIYATINSATQRDFSGIQLSLVNSLDEYNPIYALGEAEKANNILFTRSVHDNGLYAFPVRCGASETMDEESLPIATMPRFALCAAWYDSNGEHKIYSQYAIVMAPEQAGTATTLTLEGLNDNSRANPATGVDLQLRTDTTETGEVKPMRLRLGTGGARVYRKFIECVGVHTSHGASISSGETTFNRVVPTINDTEYRSLQTIFETPWGQDEDIISFEYPEGLMNLYVTLRYYVWNYDGTITTRDFVVIYDDGETIPAYGGE